MMRSKATEGGYLRIHAKGWYTAKADCLVERDPVG